MLLQSTTKLICSIELTLLFDDNVEKTIKISGGEYALIKFRHNGNKLKKVVKIKSIKPQFSWHTGECIGCILRLDLADQFNSNSISIKTDRILDIKIISETAANELLKVEEITDEMFNPDPDYEIDPEMGVVPDEMPSVDVETPINPDDTDVDSSDDIEEDPDGNDGESKDDVEDPDNSGNSTDDTNTDVDSGDPTDGTQTGDNVEDSAEDENNTPTDSNESETLPVTEGEDISVEEGGDVDGDN